MKELTVYIECYNDAKRLDMTLNSLKCFKNVIVIDKSSTDNTYDVVNKYNRMYKKIKYCDLLYNSDEGVEILKGIWDELETEWIMEVTCSDIIHPLLYNEIIKKINSDNDIDVIYVPIYRYSMGYVSKYSVYGGLGYQPKVFKKDKFDFGLREVHGNRLSNIQRVSYLKDIDSKIALYHLTHENLDLIIERHLRYARLEAEQDKNTLSRDVYLKKSWLDLWKVLYRYIKLRTYKLKQKGKAQFCMWMFYKSAKYLFLYFDKDTENEIKTIYDSIRSGKF